VVEASPLDQPTEAALEADCRAGAKTILEAVRRRRFANRSEGQRLRKLLRYENALWSTGILLVAALSSSAARRAMILRPLNAIGASESMGTRISPANAAL
jgi:ribonuclease HII